MTTNDGTAVSILSALAEFKELVPLLNEGSGDLLTNAEIDCWAIESLILKASNQVQLLYVDKLLERILCQSTIDIPEDTALFALWGVCDSSATTLPESIFASDVPPLLRMSVIERMFKLFQKVYPLRCDNVLIEQYFPKGPSWNSQCYLWWDLLPRNHEVEDGYLAEVDLKIIELLGSTLRVDHLACQQSALLGLSEWFYFNPEETVRTIQLHELSLPEELRDMAKRAKLGDV